MCRILSYIGNPIVLDDLLYKTDNSFIKQSYHPKYMSHLLNLAGFGLVAWDKNSYDPTLPYIYKTAHLPFYDENLKNLANKITPFCLLTHLRGVSYSEKQIVSQQNVHPFIFPNTNIALAHNGFLFDFDKIRYDLLEYIPAEIVNLVHGNTDSEWMYALFLAQLGYQKQNPTANEVLDAVVKSLAILQKIRRKHNIKINSPVNLFITDGNFIAATRFVFDYGWVPPKSQPDAHYAYHSLWYTFGESYGFYDDEYKMKESKKKNSVILSSEPLTEDTTTWIEVPEYTFILASLTNGEVDIVSHDISL
jgi:glutamine amidotransferase